MKNGVNCGNQVDALSADVKMLFTEVFPAEAEPVATKMSCSGE